MRLAAPALLLIGILEACSGAHLSPRMPPAASRIDEPARYIVAGVDNPAPPIVANAGSSPKAYDHLSVYGPTVRALGLLRDVEHDYALHEVSAWPIGPLRMHCAVLKLANGADQIAVLAAMNRDHRVRIAEPLQNFSTQTAIYDDPYVALQRGFQRMDVADAHPWSRGEGVRIAIIDTGADTDHPDLRGAISQIANFVDTDAVRFRRDRHGTELAGIIAAVSNNREGIVGVAPGARLLIFKACWQLSEEADAARCNSFTLAQALTAAIDARAQIVNLSIRGPADSLLRDLIQEGLRRGILFVGAAAQEGAGSAAELFSFGGVIEVTSGGAQGDAGTPLHAPGEEILSLLPGGHYDFASGTSLATAHVTGTVALLLERDPKLSSAAVYRLLRETTDHRQGDAGDADSVNACAAVTSLAGRGTCRSMR
ncbi:MAG: S8 family serine peptidase [Pseudomonadota bacterium]|nr:S8 family serine peptidase [Pseudomonadota bacterium]